jgi:hypothetical protein
MDKLKTTKKEVYHILKNMPETRNNDMILFYEYCISHWVREYELFKVFKDNEFRKQKNISPFETVSRCRRELQNEFIELKSDEQIEKLRKENEEIYREFFSKGD